MNVDDAIYHALTNNVSITALVGSRVHSGGRAPQDQLYPHVVFQRISAPTQLVSTGTSGYRTSRYRLECWATTKDLAEDVAAAIADQYDGFTLGNLSPSVLVQAIREEDRVDAGWNESLRAHRVDIIMAIDWNENDTPI